VTDGKGTSDEGRSRGLLMATTPGFKEEGVRGFLEVERALALCRRCSRTGRTSTRLSRTKRTAARRWFFTRQDESMPIRLRSWFLRIACGPSVTRSRLDKIAGYYRVRLGVPAQIVQDQKRLPSGVSDGLMGIGTIH
jgi:hypothetical protein